MTGEVEQVTCGIVSAVVDGPVLLDTMTSASTLTPGSTGRPRLLILPGKHGGISLAVLFITPCFRVTPSITNGVSIKVVPLVGKGGFGFQRIYERNCGAFGCLLNKCWRLGQEDQGEKAPHLGGKD